jgi:hypothetical protein
MQVELIRSELQRLLRQVPFRPFVLTLQGGERVVIEHPENIAFDPRPGASTDFYVLTGSVRLFSTFEAVSSAGALASLQSGNSEQPVQS